MWWAGRWAAAGGHARIALAVPAAAASTFFFANLGMFWLAPSPSAPTALAFAGAVAGYFPGYLLTMTAYVAAGLVIGAALQLRASSAVSG